MSITIFAKIGVDTAENEPPKVSMKWGIEPLPRLWVDRPDYVPLREHPRISSDSFAQLSWSLRSAAERAMSVAVMDAFLHRLETLEKVTASGGCGLSEVVCAKRGHVVGSRFNVWS